MHAKKTGKNANSKKIIVNGAWLNIDIILKKSEKKKLWKKYGNKLKTLL